MQSFTHQVRDWAAKQPHDAEYDYFDNDNCALCQFLKATGYTDTPSVGGFAWHDSDEPTVSHDLEEGLRRALSREPHNFGALADRLSA